MSFMTRFDVLITSTEYIFVLISSIKSQDIFVANISVLFIYTLHVLHVIVLLFSGIHVVCLDICIIDSK